MKIHSPFIENHRRVIDGLLCNSLVENVNPAACCSRMAQKERHPCPQRKAHYNIRPVNALYSMIHFNSMALFGFRTKLCRFNE